MGAGVIISLPMPPSTNNLFATYNGRRIITRGYKAWKLAAGASLSRYAPEPLERPYGVHIRLNMDHRGDVDNRAKPVLDLLVSHKVISGDNFVNTLRIDRDRTVSECEVEIWSLAGEGA